MAYSFPDDRNYWIFPNQSRTVQGTLIYDVQTSCNSSVPGTDDRTVKPTDCRISPNIPQNSRTAPNYD